MACGWNEGNEGKWTYISFIEPAPRQFQRAWARLQPSLHARRLGISWLTGMSRQWTSRLRTHKGTRAYGLRNIALCTNHYHNYQASHAMKFHHVPPFVQELPSGSNGPARWSESMEKMYGPPPRVPQGFSQLDADTESKKNAIGLVMASGLDYKRAVWFLGVAQIIMFINDSHHWKSSKKWSNTN